MDAETLKSTTMSPESRTLLKMVVDDENMTDTIFDTLMGKDVRKRFLFIKDHALEVKDLDI
jgi:DNA gyrase/topoisomerase IV subunit B